MGTDSRKGAGAALVSDSEAVHKMRHLMCSPGGRRYVEDKVLIPFGYSLDPGPVSRALDVLIEEAERIADNMEDQRREPDKTLCNVQSLRRAIANALLDEIKEHYAARQEAENALHDLTMEGRIAGLSLDGVSDLDDPTGSLARAAKVLRGDDA